MEERRTHPRQDVSLPCDFIWESFPVSGKTLNVSLGGALIEAPIVPKAGAQVDFSLEGSWFRGVVVRSGWYSEAKNGSFALLFEGVEERRRGAE